MRIGGGKTAPWWFRSAAKEKICIRVIVNVGKQGGSARVLTFGEGQDPNAPGARGALQRISLSTKIPIDSSLGINESEKAPIPVPIGYEEVPDVHVHEDEDEIETVRLY